MTRIAVILGSTRPERRGDQVAHWVHEVAVKRGDAEFDLIDLADHPLPHLDEATPPMLGQYANDHTKSWAALIAQYDGFVFVTPEYNHSTSGALKNAIDYLFSEWNNKAAGIVSYGSRAGGARAAEHLRLILGELMVADVRAQVTISIQSHFEDYRVFRPDGHLEDDLSLLLGQVVAWSTALQPLRASLPDAA
jgi:NAD(P)H-dependent FMN reductase